MIGSGGMYFVLRFIRDELGVQTEGALGAPITVPLGDEVPPPPFDDDEPPPAPLTAGGVSEPVEPGFGGV